MISRWQWLVRQLTRRIWFRSALLSVLAVATALAAIVLAPFIPSELSAQIGSDAVDDILNILATSMLAVTTFSLTTMVSAYSAATNNVTPRATKLLREDPTSQNVLATFIGSFLYSLVGIIALSTGAYGSQGRVVLFAVTIGVIVLIVITLLRWIEYLSRLGQVGQTTDRVEDATAKAIQARAKNPFLGGRPLHDPDRDIPSRARPLHCGAIGYVQYIDVRALSECAQKQQGEVFVTAMPGTFVDRSRPLAWLLDIEDEQAESKVRASFTVDDERSFDQDPRFGLAVLAEIASRALSPAMNDPGTAIDVIGRAVRILASCAHDGSAGQSPRGADPRTARAGDMNEGPCDDELDTRTKGRDAPEDVPCPRVHVPAVRIGDMFDDIFTPIARDGAAIAEVQVRLQKALLSLGKLHDPRFVQHAARHARVALERAEAALTLSEEKTRLRRIAAQTQRLELRTSGAV